MVHTKLRLVLGILVFLPATGLFNAAWAEVIVQRTPDGGLQPRLVQDGAECSTPFFGPRDMPMSQEHTCIPNRFA